MTVQESHIFCFSSCMLTNVVQYIIVDTSEGLKLDLQRTISSINLTVTIIDALSIRIFFEVFDYSNKILNVVTSDP